MLIFFSKSHSQGFPLALSQLFDSVKGDNKAPPISCLFFFPHIFLASSCFPLACNWCWLSFLIAIVDTAVSVTLGFPGATLCAGCAVDCDRDRTRQQGKVGGMEQKKGLRVIRLLRSGREDYVECVVNGCVERGP